MKRNKKTYSVYQLVSSAFMILALLWLTVSLPFVYEANQQQVGQSHVDNSGGPLSGSEEESSNPFGNNTEEKNPNSSNSFSEEYLHDHHASDHFFSIAERFHKCENADTYVAFHGELLVPPPNIA
jgi:hypothetical protein